MNIRIRLATPDGGDRLVVHRAVGHWPLIMAVANFIQFKLNPQMGTDPVQQKIFMLMPLVMSVTFAFFPAGLVLYWVTNTVLSIAQQWNINRRIAAQAAKARS